METVGGVSNSMGIAVNFIFDSNDEKALPLARESLHLFCSGKEMFSMFETVYYPVRCVNVKENLKLT